MEQDWTAQAEDVLGELEWSASLSAEEWSTRVLSATFLVNKAMEQEPDRGRLVRWLEKLFKAAKEATERYDATGFSISVGFPAGVTATVDWSAEKD